MDAGYYTHRSRSTRAASAHHTEASGRREPFIRQWYKDEPDAFQVGDTVEVVDAQSIHYRQQGVVRLRMTPKKFGVKFAWNAAAIFPFKSHQLRKIEPKVEAAPLLLTEYSSVISWTERDKFSCTWGVYRLDIHPDIPRRFIAYQKRQAVKRNHLQNVIGLPAHSQSTIDEARAAFAAQVAALDICPVETARMNAILEQARNCQDTPRTQKNRHPRRAAMPPPVPHQKSHKRAMPPKFKIRSYAA